MAALLPLVATISAKIGGRSFSNSQPRDWLAKQTGWRARANAAQANTFEALPFFYAALLYAIVKEGDIVVIHSAAIAWLILRLIYIAAYVMDKAMLRSLIWFSALACNVWLLFA